MKTYPMTWERLTGENGFDCQHRVWNDDEQGLVCGFAGVGKWHNCVDTLCPLLKDLPAAECGRCEEVKAEVKGCIGRFNPSDSDEKNKERFGATVFRIQEKFIPFPVPTEEAES
jgi:hypothetical protein